jgi:uncharacterized membrane protein
MKTLAGVIGFVMLFALPSEQALTENLWKAMAIYAVWAGVSVSLIAYASAFKRPSTNKSVEKL